MKKGLRSRIRALQCIELDLSETVCPATGYLQRRYAEGFDRAVRLVVEYMDKYAPLPEMLFDHVKELRKKQVAEIHGNGQPGTVVSNAGFILACSQALKLVCDEHGDEIERAVRCTRDDEASL